MNRQQLATLVDDGLSVRELGTRLGRSPTSIRYWLAKYGLVTRRAASRLRLSTASGLEVEAVCPRHGLTSHRARVDSGYACRRCRSEAVTRRRRRLKQQLVEEAGGCCALCGYSRSSAALVFHHLDPTRKSFGLAHRGYTRSLQRAREEVGKCLLLCANCHAEVEAGVAALAPSPEQGGPG